MLSLTFRPTPQDGQRNFRAVIFASPRPGDDKSTTEMDGWYKYAFRSPRDRRRPPVFPDESAGAHAPCLSRNGNRANRAQKVEDFIPWRKGKFVLGVRSLVFARGIASFLCGFEPAGCA
jgi:hypothetical protein